MNHRELVQLCRPLSAPPPYRKEHQDRRFVDHLIPLNQWRDDRVYVALLGIPTDIGVQRNGGRAGAALGPAAIHSALVHMTTSRDANSLPNELAILDCGVLVTDDLSLEAIHQRQQRAVQILLESGATVIVLGGGHDCALPSSRALAQKYRRTGVLNVDAHLDVRPPTDEGSHSGSPFRELLDDPTGTPMVFIEFGVQPFAIASHHMQYVQQHGHCIWTLPAIRQVGLARALETVLAALQQCDGVHLSLDLDGIASAYAPGVSAPATDGFVPADIATIIEHIVMLPQCRIIDVVELNPRVDVDGRTARLAAWLVAHAIWTVAHRTC